MAHTMSVRYGNVIGKNRQCRILSYALDPEGGGTARLIDVFSKQDGYVGSIMSNDVDDSMGQWYGTKFVVGHEDDGKVLILKSIHKFGPSVVSSSILPLRLRSSGPLVAVKALFPYIRGFAHQDDLLVFSGRADVLTKKELKILGLHHCLASSDMTYGFDEDDREASYDITIKTSGISGYQERPEFVSIESHGTRTGVAVPKPHQRRIRVSAPAKVHKPVTTRRRRRRSP